MSGCSMVNAMCWSWLEKVSSIALAFSWDEVSMSMSSTYLVKKTHEWQALSALRSSRSMYVIASRPERLDPIGRPEHCLNVLSKKSKCVLDTMTDNSWWTSEVVSPKQCRSDEAMRSVIKSTAGRAGTEV